MTLYATPEINADRRQKLSAIDDARADLGRRIVPTEKWVSAMRRASQASAYSSSTRIEGYDTPPERAVELLGDATASGTNELAFSAYARAMQHVGVLAQDEEFEWSRRLVLDLHFDVCAFQPEASPGALRTGPIYVTGPVGSTAFEGPPAQSVPSLIQEFVDVLTTTRDHPLIAAAMAHLNLVSIHPFEDGNGRIARVIQSLVIARTGETAPELGSIEEFLSSHTAGYYAALATAQGGKLDPDRPASEWIDFCLDAHLTQAESRVQMVAAAADRWQRLERKVESKGWPDRMVVALEQALSGMLTRSTYVQETGIAEPTASVDLRRLVDANMLDVAGGGRSTHYVPAPGLREIL